MWRYLVGGLAALVASVSVLAAAAPASAGCLYGGAVISKCDGPVQPDGTWQRCVATAQMVPRGASSYLVPVKQCDVIAPGQPFVDPPTHIDD